MSEKWIKCGVIVSFVMLIVVIIGIVIGLFNISISLPSAKIEKTVYTVYTLEEPISLEMLPALKISPLYYIELIVKPMASLWGWIL